MSGGDFYGSEVSTTVASATNARIELVGADGAVTVLKAKTPLAAGEIIDAAVMSRKALRAFFAEQIEAAKKEGVLFSLHVKATMMKISDPIVFGHAVSVFFADVIEKHAATLKRLGVNLNNGFGDLWRRSRRCRRPRRKRSRPTSQPNTRNGRASPWSIPTRGSPTSTCPAT